MEDYLLDLSYLNISLCHLFKDDFKEAYNYLRLCSDNEVGEYSFRALKGYVFVMAKDLQNAEKYFKRSVKIDRNKHQGYKGLIMLYSEGLYSKEKKRISEEEYDDWKQKQIEEKIKGTAGNDGDFQFNSDF